MRERTYKINGRPCYMQDFDGINEFAEYIKNTPVSGSWRRSLEGSKLNMLESNGMYDDPDWHGAHNYAEACDRLCNGVNVNDIRRAREASVTINRPKVSRGVYGGVPIVPAYLASCPQNMLTLKPKPERRSLRVFVDCVVPWYVKQWQITSAGQDIVSALAKLDGICNYDLIAGGATTDGANVYGFQINIKTAGKPFSASRVSFCLTSPAFLRVFDLLWSGKNPNVKHMTNFGSPLSRTNALLFKNLMKKHNKDTIVIPIERVISGGEQYINKVFKEAGIEL